MQTLKLQLPGLISRLRKTYILIPRLHVYQQLVLEVGDKSRYVFQTDILPGKECIIASVPRPEPFSVAEDGQGLGTGLFYRLLTCHGTKRSRMRT